MKLLKTHERRFVDVTIDNKTIKEKKKKNITLIIEIIEPTLEITFQNINLSG